MQHGRRLAVGDVGYQRGQVIVTRSMGCCIDADSSENAVDIKIFLVDLLLDFTLVVTRTVIASSRLIVRAISNVPLLIELTIERVAFN